MPSVDSPELRWLLPDETPWPVPVLDIRPVTQTLLAHSRDPQMASNAVSYGGDDGLGFVGQEPPSPRKTSLSLRYHVDSVLADGVLFSPTTMEHKWALFHHRRRILFVRSWQRRVVVTVSTRPANGYLELSEARGVFDDPDEDPAFTSACVDYLLQSYALGMAFPAPLRTDPDSDLQSAALRSFGLFGNRALFATHHRFVSDLPDRPLRSHSLFHIAIAKGDLEAAQLQLDAGTPIDLLAGDGLTAMHWATARADTNALSWLLARGLGVDARSEEGATVLMNTAQDGDLSMATWLLDQGADPNASDNRGFGSLHRAAETGHASIVRLLLERGARRDAAAQGFTPLALAAGRQHDAIVAILEANGR